MATGLVLLELRKRCGTPAEQLILLKLLKLIGTKPKNV